MQVSIQDLIARYAEMDDFDLVRLHRSRHLTDLAKAALAAELVKRRIDPETWTEDAQILAPDQAETGKRIVAGGTISSSGLSPTKILGLIGSLVVTVVLFVALNLILVGAQELWHRGDNAKLDLLKMQLKSEREIIGSAETKLEGLEASVKRLESEASDLNGSIGRLETQYPQGVPSALYAAYERSVSDYNRLVGQRSAALATYSATYDNYSAQLDAYNEKVKAANALAERVGGTWYVVPIPVPGRGAHSSH